MQPGDDEDRFDGSGDDFIGPEEDFPVTLPEDFPPDWDWCVRIGPRPKLTEDSPVWWANRGSIRRWGPSKPHVAHLIAHRTGRAVSIHSVAKAIQRLLKRRYLRPAPAPDRWRHHFTSRKFYRVEPLGRRAARLTLQATDRMREGIVGLNPGSVGLGAGGPGAMTLRPEFRPA